MKIDLGLTEMSGSKSKGKHKQQEARSESRNTAAAKEGKLKRKDYEHELQKLQVELVKLQSWVKHVGARIVVVFEGRDAAGKEVVQLLCF